MNILIAYASTEGQTRKIAQFCASQCIAKGHSVEVIAAADATDLSLAVFDAAILAGSVHVGKVQDTLAAFAGEHAQGLSAMPSLFLQVSLAAAGEDPAERADLDTIAKTFCETSGWTPTRILQVAGAFRFTEYDFFKRWAMYWIASQKDEAASHEDTTEYTDWTQLTADLDDWMKEAEARA